MEEHTPGFDEDMAASERAFDWLRRLESGNARDTEAFYAWMSRSPQNGGEVLIATSTELIVRQLFRHKRIDVDRFLSTSANVLTIGEPADQKQAPQRARRLRLFSLAGIGIAAATAALFLTPGLVRNWSRPNEYATSVGEQRAIQLPDGSAIAINAQSSVRIAFSGDVRDVYLDRGQAMFTVAKDQSRPFRVHVSKDSPADKGTIIRALGTKFDVKRRSDRTQVAVVEGVVQVRSDDSARTPQEPTVSGSNALTRVAAGQAVSIEITGTITAPVPINLSDITAWQQRRLVFTDDTLGEIVNEFELYNRTPQMRIESDELRTLRFSGVFDADNPQALLKYLATHDSIAVDRNGGDVVVIRARTDVEQSPRSTTD